jgi:hypothetical protein
MHLFDARVHGVRAEAGKLIYDVDVNGQKSAPWTYRVFPRREDIWGMNIHTTGEERDSIMRAILAYDAGHPADSTAAFATAKSQVISLQASATCLRCAKSRVDPGRGKPATCVECGARYELSP